ncbi:hypothetical protein DASC09_050810 [Saccharomycopsis crataegensis]|uniref:Heat shock transcription factor n=1 Tax=Saccharomycopsis crataegensis TaxID=43959 RepID=A0AAV5QT64_9ASCO|nr:hypothetical protein DASC09_050810 [Saccharomycopsis crataegensis]
MGDHDPNKDNFHSQNIGLENDYDPSYGNPSFKMAPKINIANQNILLNSSPGSYSTHNSNGQHEIDNRELKASDLLNTKDQNDGRKADDLGQGKSRPAFVVKLWIMVNDSNNSEYIQWADNGKRFKVLNRVKFMKKVLPKYFKHSNFSSFVRQLNMYGWHKVQYVSNNISAPHYNELNVPSSNASNPDEIWLFENPYFQRGREDLLENISRNKNGRQEYGEMNVNLVVNELNRLKNAQNIIADDLKRIKNDCGVFWQEMAISRQRYDKQNETLGSILRFIASVFQNNPTINPKEIPFEGNINASLMAAITTNNDRNSITMNSVPLLNNSIPADPMPGVVRDSITAPPHAHSYDRIACGMTFGNAHLDHSSVKQASNPAIRNTVPNTPSIFYPPHPAMHGLPSNATPAFIPVQPMIGRIAQQHAIPNQVPMKIFAPGEYPHPIPVPLPGIAPLVNTSASGTATSTNSMNMSGNGNPITQGNLNDLDGDIDTLNGEMLRAPENTKDNFIIPKENFPTSSRFAPKFNSNPPTVLESSNGHLDKVPPAAVDYASLGAATVQRPAVVGLNTFEANPVAKNSRVENPAIIKVAGIIPTPTSRPGHYTKTARANIPTVPIPPNMIVNNAVSSAPPYRSPIIPTPEPTIPLNPGTNNHNSPDFHSSQRLMNPTLESLTSYINQQEESINRLSSLINRYIPSDGTPIPISVNATPEPVSPSKTINIATNINESNSRVQEFRLDSSSKLVEGSGSSSTTSLTVSEVNMGDIQGLSTSLATSNTDKVSTDASGSAGKKRPTLELDEDDIISTGMFKRYKG